MCMKQSNQKVSRKRSQVLTGGIAAGMVEELVMQLFCTCILAVLLLRHFVWS